MLAKQNEQTWNNEAGHSEKHANHRIDEVQKQGCEVQAALELFETCDLANVIHAAKITSFGEAHKQKTQAYLAKVKWEIASNNREKNICTKLEASTYHRR